VQHKCRLLLVNAVLVGFLILTAHPVSLAKAGFEVKPPQSWVRTVAQTSEGKSLQLPSGSSSSFILSDRQIKVGEKTVDRFYHYAQRVDTAAGLDGLSQLKFYFEPSYQQLTIHFIHIRRGDTTIDALKPSEIRVIQQEEELNQQLYNGTLAALVFLNDLRVGDIVDYSYTISGENPVLGGRFTEKLYLADSQPIQQLELRVVCPSKRVLLIRNRNIEIQPAVRTFDNESEYVWKRRNAAAVTTEDSTPDWFDSYPAVSLSEFGSWEDVVQWALPLYQLSAVSPPELVAKTEHWKNEFASPEQRTVAALRFVQDEIRYLGIELGRYSHQPTSPAKVFTRRFGDCKDKSLLLSTILTSMGIDAAPALVNSREGASLETSQPSPFAFDHVIVKTKINGKTYWLDPTISYQRGGLDKYYDPPYERGLVLRAGTRELERIPLPSSAGALAVREVYQGINNQSSISLVVTTTYQGAEADAMRSNLSSRSLIELSRSYLNFYADANPSIRAEGLPEVDDNQNDNQLVVKERYLIDEFWKENKHRFVADKIYSELGKPGISQRTMPLSIRYPLSIKQTIEINLPEDFRIPIDRGSISDDAFRFEYDFSNDGNRIKLDYSLQTFADSVSVDKVQEHLLLVDRIQNLVGFELSGHSSSAAANWGGSSSKSLDVVVGVLVLPLLLVLTGLAIRGRVRKRKLDSFVSAIKARPGTSPETAISLYSEREIDARVNNFKCGCGHRPFDPASPPKHERFTYDGQRLVGIRLHCNSCGQNHDLYINHRSDQPPELANLSTP
jgi:transglutaminase-like putative cysteine protease